ncbi:hypothetical protein ABZ901_20090 [Actinacidiphila alni]|uniref:hypothetical protein n=1 Tax=Actinacidiphila alni TaxID=380248 RepID=UPI0033E196C4
MVTLDGCAGTLTVVRAGLWTGGAALVLVMLWPPRVTADERWLTVRGPLGARRIRVDALVCVQRYGLVAAVLELRDARGRRLRLPMAVLEADPVLWQAVESGIRRSRERGTLLTGRRAAAAAAARVDARAAEILHASGLG